MRMQRRTSTGGTKWRSSSTPSTGCSRRSAPQPQEVANSTSSGPFGRPHMRASAAIAAWPVPSSGRRRRLHRRRRSPRRQQQHRLRPRQRRPRRLPPRSSSSGSGSAAVGDLPSPPSSLLLPSLALRTYRFESFASYLYILGAGTWPEHGGMPRRSLSGVPPPPADGHVAHRPSARRLATLRRLPGRPWPWGAPPGGSRGAATNAARLEPFLFLHFVRSVQYCLGLPLPGKKSSTRPFCCLALGGGGTGEDFGP